MLDDGKGIVRALVTGAVLALLGTGFAACSSSSDAGGGNVAEPDAGTGTPDSGSTADAGGGTDAATDGSKTGTVSGRLVARNYRSAVAGAAVVINGHAVVTSSATGTFSVPDVTPPYDVIIAPSTTVVSIYRGLTRMDPVLPVVIDTAPAQKSTTLAGNITGAPAGPTPTVVFAGPGRASGLVGAPMDAYSGLTAYWYGDATSITGALFANIEIGNPATDAYHGKAGNVTVLSGATQGGGNIAVTQVGITTLKGTLTVPAAYTMYQTQTGWSPEPGAPSFVHRNLGPPNLTSYQDTFARMPNGSVWVDIAYNPMASPYGETSWARKSAPSSAVTSIVDIAFPAVPQPSSPADAATGVTTATSFAYSAVPNTVYELEFQGNTPRIFLVTGDVSTTIPDLSAAGLALPKNAQYGWQVFARGPYASVDDLTKDDAFAYGVRDMTDYVYSASATRTLTTAP